MAITKVAIFVDGKNFYEGLRSSEVQSRIDFGALAELMVREVTQEKGVLTGLHYFTGVDYRGPAANSDSEDEEAPRTGTLENFLSFLETQPGCFVYRFSRRVRTVKCQECGHEHSYSEEKAVDTSLVSVMIRQAAIQAFDAAVLCSGDADHTPALEALRDLGKPTWVATFGGRGLSRRLRQAAFGHIDLAKKKESYIEGEEEEEDESNFDIVMAVQEAEKYFGEERYVGFNMFLDRWRSTHLPRDVERRKDLLNAAMEEGLVEAYDAEDGCRAIRTTIWETSD